MGGVWKLGGALPDGTQVLDKVKREKKDGSGTNHFLTIGGLGGSHEQWVPQETFEAYEIGQEVTGRFDVKRDGRTFDVFVNIDAPGQGRASGSSRSRRSADIGAAA